MQPEKKYQEDMVEISLMDLFWSVLRHWRSIIIGILVSGILLGGYYGYGEYRDRVNTNLLKKRQAEYEEALQTYETEKILLEKRLSNLENIAVRQQFEQDNALMLKIDPYNVYIRIVTYYINTGYEIIPELYYQNPNYTAVITNSYKSAVDRMQIDSIIATEECPDLTVRNPNGGTKKVVQTAVDSSSGLFTIKICTDTEERTDLIYKAVKETISAEKDVLNQKIGEHTLETILEDAYVDVDMEFDTVQTTFEEKMAKTEEEIEATKEEIKALKKPVNQTPTKKTIINKTVKYGFIGAFLGLFLMLLFYLVRIMIQDKLNSVETIRRRYSAPVLGVYADRSDLKTRLDCFFAKKLGMNVSKSKEEQLEYICSSIRFYLKDERKLLLVGNCEMEKLNELKEALSSLLEGVEIKAGGNVNETPQAIDALSGNMGVICVEKWTKTANREIRHELGTVEASGNKKLGYIVVS